MRLIICLVLSIFTLTLAAQDKDEAARKELIKLQGDWKLTAGQVGGKAFPQEVVSGFSMAIKDNQYEFRNSLETEKGQLLLNPTTKPTQIEITITEGSFKGQKQLGIYELSDKKVKFCLANPGETTRPDKFVTTAENQWLLFEFEQTKK